MMRNYDGNEWGHNGPHMLTRVFNKVCGVPLKKMPMTCSNFTMFARETCYVIEWRSLFNPTKLKFVMNLAKKAHFIHTWNHECADQALSKTKDSETGYIKLAQMYCPKVLAASTDSF